MKKSLIVLFLFVFAFSAFADDFITTYDDIMDVTFITHKDMKIGALYNLRDDLAGERENLRLYKSNNVLILAAIYQYSSWAFVEKLTFLNDNGARCVVKIGKHNREVLSGSAVREYLYSALTETAAAELKEVLSGSNPVVVFSGTKARSEKLKIKPKVSSAMLETIEYFENRE